MEEKKKKTTAAQIKATEKYQKKAYFKTLVRFPIEKENDIRTAAGESLNGFIVKTILDKISCNDLSNDQKQNAVFSSILEELETMEEKQLTLVLNFVRMIKNTETITR